MAKFRDVEPLQKFSSVHASIHNHFNFEHHLNRRETSSRIVRSRWPSGVNWPPEPRDVGQFRDWFAKGLTPPRGALCAGCVQQPSSSFRRNFRPVLALVR